LFVFIILAILTLLANILFPNVAYAMEPPKDFVVDFYGAKEYVGPDAYGYFNNPTNKPTILASSDLISSSQDDSYGKPQQKTDWYATNDPHIIQPAITNDKSVFTFIYKT